MELNFKINNVKRNIRIENDGENFRVVYDGDQHAAQLVSLGDGSYILSVDNRNYPVYLVQQEAKRYIYLEGEYHQVEPVVKMKKGGMAGMDTAMMEDQDIITAPMPGKIVKILVKAGDKVEKGQNAVILEAMKMETHVPTPVTGTVKIIHFNVGDQVNLGDTLVELDPDSEE